MLIEGELIKNYIIDNINYKYKGDFIVESIKIENIDILGYKSDRLIVKTIDIDLSIVNHIISIRDFNLYKLNISS